MPKLLFVFLSIIFLTTAAFAQKSVEITISKNYVPLKLEKSAAIERVLHTAVEELLKSYRADEFKNEEIAATLIDMRDHRKLRFASFRGNERIYPASVVKMFYMAALHQQLEDGKVRLTPELTRGLKDMIVDSSNEATQYILDVLTDTSSGAELPQKEFEKWQHKRNRVNRYFSSMGYRNINVNQKTFCEDAYGIEQQSRGYKGLNRNMLTTDATAGLLAEIVLGRSVTPKRSSAMMELMKRDPFADTGDADSQARGFTGKILLDRKMKDAKLWSKAGWTLQTRHDAAYIETADGLKFVLVIFTENHAGDRNAIPNLAGKVIDEMSNWQQQ